LVGWDFEVFWVGLIVGGKGLLGVGAAGCARSARVRT
jgi:hypothetical protein